MRRVLRSFLIVCAAAWLVSALPYWLWFGRSSNSFWTGLTLLPRLVEWTTSERIWAGIETEPAIPQLRRSFGHGVRPADGRRLFDLIVSRRYTRGLEVGTAHGYSSLWIALALSRNGGRLTTVEIDPGAARVAARNFRAAGLDGIIDLRVNDALREIPALPGEFDFVFMDPGVRLNKKLLDLVRTRIVKGGAIVAHNALLFPLAQPDYLKAITSDPSLDTRIVPTPSTGFSVTTVR